MNEELDFLYDHTEDTSSRFVCFISANLNRYDLAIISTNRFYGKKLVIDIQSGRTAIMGPDDLDQEGYLEHAFKIKEEEAADLKLFLEQVVGTVNFSDF